MKKCLKCPYRLGYIKCITDPCNECKEKKLKKPPFPEVVVKESNIEKHVK